VTQAHELAKSLYERLKSGDANVEEKLIDIKKQWHHAQLSRPRDEVREEFCKDICAIANACYPSSGFILFGLSTDAPHIFSSQLPLDEASLQQQITGGISPAPEVRFEQFQLDGVWISAATISSSLRNLPHVAKYKSNLWIPWVRQGSSTRTASHLDLVSMFDLRREAEQRAIPRMSVVGQLKWAGNWSINNNAGRWSPSGEAPKSNDPVSGFNTTIQMTNAGTLPTSFTALSLKILFKDGTEAVSSSCFPVGGWPLEAPGRSGRDYHVTFYCRTAKQYPSSVIDQVTIIGTDIENERHSFEIDREAFGGT
jgi:hypothetical protein